MKTNQETSATRADAPRAIRTARQAETAPPGLTRVEDSAGLYLNVKGKARSWTLRFRDPARKGKIREMGLGPFPEISLAGAREKAKQARELIRDGHDPIKVRERKRAAAVAEAAVKPPVTFAEAVSKYLDARAAIWRHPRAREAWLSPIALYALPTLGPMSLDSIRIEHVLAAMTTAQQAVSTRAVNQRRNRNGKASAKLVRQRIGQVIDFAAAIGDRDQTLANPAAFGPIDKAKPMKRLGERDHFRRIDDLKDAPAELQALIAALTRKPSSALAAHIFMIATAARPSEALQSRWSEFDLETRVWTLPPERTKSYRRHVVPLSDLAILAIEQQAQVRRCDFVFPAARRSRKGAQDGAYSYGGFAEAPGRAGLNLKTSPHGCDQCSAHGPKPSAASTATSPKRRSPTPSTKPKQPTTATPPSNHAAKSWPATQPG